MKSRLADCAVLCALALVACGDGGAPRGSGILDQTDNTSNDPLVGTWRTDPIPFDDGDGSGTYTHALTFHAKLSLDIAQVLTFTNDNAFAGCVTTTTASGSYSETRNVLTLTLDDYGTETERCAERSQDDIATRLAEGYDAEPYPPGGGNEFRYIIANDTLSLTLTYGTEGPVPTIYHRL